MTFLIPVLWIKTIKKLTFINVFALGVILFALATIITYNIIYIRENTFPEREIKYFDAVNFPIFFGIAVLNFEGNPASLNIQASMKKPRNYLWVLWTSAIVTTLIVFIQASLSYTAYGSYIDELVTLNLPANSLTSVLRIMYAIALIMSYPIQMFAAVEIIENLEIYKSLPNSSWFPNLKHIVVRTCIVLFTGFIAIEIPKFDLFLSFLGSFGGTFLCFIFPFLFYNRTFQASISNRRLWTHWILMGIGVFLGMLSVYKSFTKLLAAFFAK